MTANNNNNNNSEATEESATAVPEDANSSNIKNETAKIEHVQLDLYQKSATATNNNNSKNNRSDKAATKNNKSDNTTTTTTTTTNNSIVASSSTSSSVSGKIRSREERDKQDKEENRNEEVEKEGIIRDLRLLANLQGFHRKFLGCCRSSSASSLLAIDPYLLPNRGVSLIQQQQQKSSSSTTTNSSLIKSLVNKTMAARKQQQQEQPNIDVAGPPDSTPWNKICDFQIQQSLKHIGCCDDKDHGRNDTNEEGREEENQTKEGVCIHAANKTNELVNDFATLEMFRCLMAVPR